MRETSLARSVLALLRKKGLTLVTAESLTGGMIGSTITGIPGASDVYWGGFVTYTIDAKQQILGVDAQIIREYGVVSRETACAMAEGALTHSHASVSVAVTGVAGPGGGSAEIPVGTVWLSLGRKREGLSAEIVAERLQLKGGRNRVRHLTVVSALSRLMDLLDRG
jgi:nicotinamide-nucleotide amidase